MMEVWIAGIVFCLSGAVVAYVYAGYPFVIWALSRLRPFRHECPEDEKPFVSVLLCAHNEEACIGEKIGNLLEQEYPADRMEILVASDGSTDRTNEIVESVTDPRVRFFPHKERQGKSALLNELIEKAVGEVLILTDANSMYHPRVLYCLARHFLDTEVGLVTGEMRWIQEASESAVGKGSRLYWGYESFVKRAENRLGSVFVAVGSCFAMRASLIQTLYPDVANDFQMPMEVGAAGKKLIYDPEAWSSEFNTSSGKEEFGRTVRIVTRGMTGVRRMWGRIRGLRRFQLLSRKIVRWLVPDFLILAFLSNLVLARHHWVWAFFLLLQGFCYLLAALGGLWSRLRKGKAPRFLSVPFYYCLLNAAALAAQWNFIRGRTFSTWKPTEDSRRVGN